MKTFEPGDIVTQMTDPLMGTGKVIEDIGHSCYRVRFEIDETEAVERTLHADMLSPKDDSDAILL